MIILVPLDENQNDVCPSFGRAPYFLRHDSARNFTDYLENPAANVHGGAGLTAAQCLVDCGADSLITVRCGENAEKVLSAANISIYKAVNGSAMENVQALIDGKLSILDHFHAGFHGKI